MSVESESHLLDLGVLAATAKYPSVLARGAFLQIFATKNIVFYNYKFLQQKRGFLHILQQKRPKLALTALR